MRLIAKSIGFQASSSAMTPTRRTIELCAGHAKAYAVQAAQTLNVDTAVPQYRHSYTIGSGIVNHHRIIRFECKPNRWNCWKRKGKKQRTKSVKVECICTEKQRLIH